MLARLCRPTCLTVTIWVIGISVLIILFVGSLLCLLSEYRHNNVATQIAIVRNGSTRPPFVTVCIPYHSYSLEAIAEWLLERDKNASIDCIECEELEENEWDVWKDLDLKPYMELPPDVGQTRLENAVASAILRKLVAGWGGFEALILNRSNWNWNQPLIDAVQRLFVCGQIQDDAYLINSSSSAYFCDGFDMSIIGRMIQSTAKKLRDSLFEAIDMYLRIEVIDKSMHTTESELENRSVSIVENQLCVQILGNSVKEIFEYVALPDTDPPPWERYKRSVPLHLWEDNSAVYTLSDKYSSENLYTTDSEELEKVTTERIRIEFNVAAKMVETRPNTGCVHDDEPPIACIIEYQVDVALKSCGCIPLGYWEHVKEVRPEFLFCDTENFYKTCAGRLARSLRDHEEECNNKCEHTFYEFKQSVSIDHDISNGLEFEIEIAPDRSTPYIEFSVTAKDSPERFAAQIGALANFFLGLNGLLVLAVIVFCADWVKRMCCHFGHEKGSHVPNGHTLVQYGNDIHPARNFAPVSNRGDPLVSQKEMMEMEKKMVMMVKEETFSIKQEMAAAMQRLEHVIDEHMKLTHRLQAIPR